MHWRKKRLIGSRLYAITDIREGDKGLVKQVEGAFRGGVDILQLRSKHLSDRKLIQLGRKLKRIAHKHGGLLIVNDRCDLALLIGADGVHLGQDDLTVREARRILRDKTILIGRSTHSLREALCAEKDGADYIGTGPIFGTPTKPDYKPVGLGLIGKVKRAVRIPFFAIGGVDETTINKVLKAGASRVAVVRAIFGKPSAERAAQGLKKRFL
ncbi:MAG: thiamine phosphate synthase [Candidatus Omnitrophica bacterium]|nr:thiamine phosphate synthase [Candidatus Omnitrophota bacterium]